MNERKDRVILADYFLRRDYYTTYLQKIKTERIQNIVIIGGSHSGFSCAWMLLNGPATYNHNLSINGSCGRRAYFPGAQMKQMRDCSDCCTCKSKFPPTSPSSASVKSDKNADKSSTGDKNSTATQC